MLSFGSDTKGKICGRCTFCNKDGKNPVCIIKDLYSVVELNQECDELDSRNQLWFSEITENK